MHPPWWEICIASIFTGFNILMHNMQKSRKYKEDEETDNIMKSDTPPTSMTVSPHYWWNFCRIYEIDYYKTSVLMERELQIYEGNEKRIVKRTVFNQELFKRTVRVTIPFSPLNYERTTVRKLGVPQIALSYFYIYRR